jgi:TnsA-like endonuclease N terminal
MVQAHALAEAFKSRTNDAALHVVLPQDGKIRSRTVVSRSRGRGTGMYPSWKMGRMIQWESPNELNALRLLDADPAVKAFNEQPLAIHFQLDNEAHLHYPDLLVEWRSGHRELWEIKPAREAAHPETARRTQFLRSALPSVGFDYRMVSGEELKREARLFNALTLLKYGRGPIGDTDRERVRLILLTSPVIRWTSAVNGDLGPRGRAILCRLALEGVLAFDRDER